MYTASLLHALRQLHLITPRGLSRLVRSFASDGVTLAALLRFAAAYYGDRTAIVSGKQSLTYSQAYRQSRQLAHVLFHRWGVTPGQRVAVLCRNDVCPLLTMVALSRLGANISLLNTDFPSAKIAEILEASGYDLLVVDPESAARCLPAQVACAVVDTAALSAEVNNDKVALPHVRQGGLISVFTGGSSGQYKEARRHTGVMRFLPPFMALLHDVRLQRYDSVLIALPFYHGFGLTTFIIGMTMGCKLCLVPRFDVQQVLDIVHSEHIEVLPVVPAMLSRLWQHAEAKASCQSVKCIVCGGDRLDEAQLRQTQQQLPDAEFYNLYGTSEAGFFLLATPQDLSVCGAVTLGRPIRGVRCQLRDQDSSGVGELWVSSAWAMNGREGKWQNTGDRVSCDARGYYFYRGRGDRMVVCGGENVFPDDVERILCQHPSVANVVVYSVPDLRFGNILNAQVELKNGAELTEQALILWLRQRVHRAAVPHHIEFGCVKLTSTGKRRSG